jgi:hypothetical protein
MEYLVKKHQKELMTLFRYSFSKICPYDNKKLIRRSLLFPLRGLYISIKLKEAMVVLYIVLYDFYSLKDGYSGINI